MPTPPTLMKAMFRVITYIRKIDAVNKGSSEYMKRMTLRDQFRFTINIPCVKVSSIRLIFKYEVLIICVYFLCSPFLLYLIY